MPIPSTTLRMVELYETLEPQLMALHGFVNEAGGKAPERAAPASLVARINRALKDAARVVSRLPAARHVRPLPEDASFAAASLAIQQARTALGAFRQAYEQHGERGYFWRAY